MNVCILVDLNMCLCVLSISYIQFLTIFYLTPFNLYMNHLCVFEHQCVFPFCLGVNPKLFLYKIYIIKYSRVNIQ